MPLPKAMVEMLNSLRARVLLVVALALVPIFLLLLISATAERTAGVERALESARSTANLVADQQKTIVASANQLLTFVTSLMDRPITNTEGCDLALARLIVGKTDYLGLTITDASGVVRCAAPRLPGMASLNITDQLYFRRAVQARAFAIGGFQLSRLTGRPALTFGAPAIDRTGQITAVVVAGIDLLELNERLQAIELPKDVVVWIADDAGTVLAHHPGSDEWIGRQITDTLLLERIRSERAGTAHLADRTSADRWHAFATVGDPISGTGGLYVDVSYPGQSLFAAVDARLRLSLLSLIVGSVLAMSLAFGATSYMITDRAQRLTRMARRLAAGDWTVRSRIQDHTEFGLLAATFDDMADALQAHEREMLALNSELEERVARRSTALEHSNVRLRASRTELRRLSQALVDIAEQERMRLSREVHDQIGQALTGVKMDVSAARQRLMKDDVAGAEVRLAAAIELIDETIRMARRIALDLRPSLLDDFGLAAAVEWQLEDFGQRAGIRHHLASEVDAGAVSPALATAAFRILKEALANITRHAAARTVDVRLATDSSHLTLVVRDDGRGITDEEQSGPHSLGLLGMRERALQLGGTVSVVGTPGDGTVVTLVLPLETPDTIDPEEDRGDETADR